MLLTMDIWLPGSVNMLLSAPQVVGSFPIYSPKKDWYANSRVCPPGDSDIFHLVRLSGDHEWNG